MCVTNVYIDRYPDGREVEFRQTSICQYGQPGRPCDKHATLENPVRNMHFGEPTSEYTLTSRPFLNPSLPNQPGDGEWSDQATEGEPVGGASSDGAQKTRARASTRPNRPHRSPGILPLNSTKPPTRQHRKERLAIVGGPPSTVRPHPPPPYLQPLEAYPSTRKNGDEDLIHGGRERGRPIIVDEIGIRTRMEERDMAIKARMEQEEEEALKQRLRERQMPRRRFSTGPENRRHRVLYDDDVYRWAGTNDDSRLNTDLGGDPDSFDLEKSLHRNIGTELGNDPRGRKVHDFKDSNRNGPLSPVAQPEPTSQEGGSPRPNDGRREQGSRDGKSSSAVRVEPVVGQGHERMEQTMEKSSSIDGGNRRKLAKALIAMGNRPGTAARDQFDNSELNHREAVNFPETPGEEQRNSALNQIGDRNNQSWDADGNLTPGLRRQNSRGSFTSNINSGLGIEDVSTNRPPSPGRLVETSDVEYESASITQSAKINTSTQSMEKRNRSEDTSRKGKEKTMSSGWESGLHRIGEKSSSKPTLATKDGSEFSYTPTIPEDVSPRSSPSPDPSIRSSSSESLPRFISPSPADPASDFAPPRRRRIITEGTFTAEEFDERDYEDRDEVAKPDQYEDAESDLELSHEEDIEAWLEARRAERLRKRRAHGSLKKRTWSLSSALDGSSTDDEDLHPVTFESANEAGFNTRRLRRKLQGESTSLLFDDPPPRMDKVDELESCEEIVEVDTGEDGEYEAGSMGIQSIVPDGPTISHSSVTSEEQGTALSSFPKLFAQIIAEKVLSLEDTASPAIWRTISPIQSESVMETESRPIARPNNHGGISRLSSKESLRSLVDSIFSTASLSSASTVPITDNAFQRVLVILKSDGVLKALYEELTAKTSAGKFNRNLGTLLKRFAVDLEKEATCWDEQRTAQFIRSRARRIAQCISNSVYPFHNSQKSQTITVEKDKDKADSSGDSDFEEEPDGFQELEKFITNSNAFQALRKNIRGFLGLEPARPASRDVVLKLGANKLFAELPFAENEEHSLTDEMICSMRDASQYQQSTWLLTGFSQKLQNLLLPDKPIPGGMSRVKWQCACGEYLYDDYQELKPGAAKRMEDFLRRSSYKSHADNGKGIAERISSIGIGLKGVIASLGDKIPSLKTSSNPELVSTELRYYSDARTTRTPAHGTGDVFYLLLCHNDGVGGEIVKLRQPDICDINNDQKLFNFLHEEYKTLRKRWWTWISLWTLQSIKFVRFELYANELVDVKKLDEVPPPAKDNEYRHGPPNPPELNPPLGSTLLMHLFKHPELAGTRKHCLKKIPRKVCNRLAVLDEEDDAIGWGLQFIEGWSKKRLMYMTAFIFGLSSLFVMVLVSILGHDIQNAAAIASFMLSFVTIGIATAQAALHMT